MPPTAPQGTRTVPVVGLLLAALLAVLGLTAVTARTASAAAPITVAQAIANQNGSTQTVRGYIVGEPVATNTVNRSGFTNDYAIALADSASTTSTGAMIYVQLTTQWRSAWGLKSNPALLGKRVDVTGPLSAYFSHAGLKSPTAISSVGTTPTPTPTRAPPLRPRRPRAAATRTPTTPPRSASPARLCAARCTRSSRPRRCSPTTRCGPR